MPTRSDPAAGPATSTLGAEVDRALARAVLARFLAGALRPVGALDAGRPALVETRRALSSAAAVLEGAATGRLHGALAGLAAIGEPRDRRAAHDQLFGHTLRGRVCPYESEYGRRAMIQQAHELADLAGFYAAFGLEPSRRHAERPDHVACELEFLEFLSAKEAWALEVGDAEMLATTRRAIERFLGEHLGRFGRAFAAGLREADPGGYYEGLAAVCEAFLELECERVGVPLGPAFLELRPMDEDQVPMACGAGDDVVQLGAPPRTGG